MNMSNNNDAVIVSLLDTDMYKLTMHAAVRRHFPEAVVVYKYTNRSPQMSFTSEAVDWLKHQISLLEQLRFTNDEIDYLRREISYLPEDYLHFLASPSFQLNPSKQVTLSSTPIPQQKNRFALDIHVEGLWKDTILYEIPLLALVSEAYFKFVDTDWDLKAQAEKARDKAKVLLSHNIVFSEFGTRRRRSFETQDIVIRGLLEAAKELHFSVSRSMLGTSNVYFAKKYGIKPIGTVAHEWIMGIASATNDYVNANENAMKYWISTFGPSHAGLALTDTFGTDNFLKCFHPPYSDAYIGVRQDSGDPVEYTKKISHHYHDVLNLPKFTKVLCYSDSLNVEKVLLYSRVANDYGMKSSFGIGTSFTNDFNKKSNPGEKSEPLNIVIKLLTVNGNPAIKISDNLGKNMGDPTVVNEVKRKLGYIERTWSGDNEAHRWAA